MNSIEIIAVGSVHRGYLDDGCREYIKRLQPLCRFSVTEIPEQKLVSDDEAGREKVIEAEGERILRQLSSRQGACVAAMCIEGKQMSSEKLAEMFKELEPSGQRIVFVIGGSLGLSDEVKRRADIRMSMSEMTFPHQMARLMLLEQIYRAQTIISGIKYHK